MDQELAIEIMLSGHNVFLTGSAGAGKTYALNKFITAAKSMGRKVAVTASTGIAATHLGGNTIHSWSGVGVRDKLPRNFAEKMAKSRQEKITKADILIIDEISMIHDYYLDMVDETCRKVRGDLLQPFGGLQVIFCGDFFQLPPVTRKNDIFDPQEMEVFDQAPDEAPRTSFAYNSRSWQETDPVILYLNSQFRQDDDEFLEILNNIRAGSINQELAQKIASRNGAKLEGYDEITELHTHNQNVDSKNDAKLRDLPGESHFYDMKTTGNARYVERMLKSCLALPRLELKLGALVMALKNDQSGRFSNGSIGTVIGFDKETDFPIVEFRNGNTETVAPDEWLLKDNETKLASLTQIPLKLAYAITVHKSQGMTLDAARMNLARTFEPGMGYVALSRVKSLKDLSIIGLNSTAFFVHPEVSQKDQEFQKKSKIALEKFEPLRSKKTIMKIPAKKMQIASSSGSVALEDVEKQLGNLAPTQHPISLTKFFAPYNNWAKENDAKRLNAQKIQPWLFEQKLLEKDKKGQTLPTKAGKKIGIEIGEFKSQDKDAKYPVYTQKAQKWLLKNLAEIVNFQNSH